ncbi:uncharacterized protein Z519_08723 [Cladophialophora bantiana CBS 173.52]|uniref:Uncharacterized protein n=1 Tax=Cladophialophora bantiana (strain ATCC 10958 / CBS 173.52 / CDC B-1940 / NIH 8579) TaxID=1442370 RepID=A0A0D2HJL6_CLAB1|nr:uncharacterized protein Z519_08723 [Cladophialophora bantiana CBS 173.52]KIW90940.1 hypothetical protein Z519_08723 [Cladophialophora bantiana CBS 173.52]
MVKHPSPHMKRGSSIVNSSSVAAYMGNPQLLDYSPTKGAITTFTRSLAQQLAPKGIRVTAVAPGIIWTPLQPATKGNPPEAMSALGVEEAPLQRPRMPVEWPQHMYFWHHLWDLTSRVKRFMARVDWRCRW